jgi:hypothetical protein
MIRVVPRDSVSRDDIDDAAFALGFLLVNIVPRSELHPAQVVYVTPDRRGSVHLVEDGGLSFVVQGDDEERWAAALRERLEIGVGVRS